jgi:hypothetical protein
MKQLSFLFTMMFWCFSNYIIAQPKHALLIGINKYYQKDKFNNIIIDSENSLHGCINDVMSIKELITSRFGFEAKNIVELYDSLATQKNILNQIDTLLAQSDSNSIAFIYYSGHGMTLKYGKDESNTAEVICPSDLLTTRKYSCIQNTELAACFNRFVDKKVILTAVFDCCFSFGTTDNRKNMWKDSTSQFINENEIIQNIKYNSKSKSLFTIAADIDESSDVKSKNVDSINFIDMDFSEIISTSKYKEIKFDEYKRIMKETEPETKEWGFQYKIFLVNPPSERPKSNFLFMSATNDKQKALETQYANGYRHSAFTTALINVFKKNPANISSSLIFYDIQKQLGERFILQTPSLSAAPEREKQTLFGMHPDSVIAFVRADYIGGKGDTILLNKGAYAGFSIGNKLMNVRNHLIVAEIVELVGMDSAKAKILTANSYLIAAKDAFIVTDWWTKSKPLVRVYIPKEVCSFGKLDTLYRKLILPLQKDKNFISYENNDAACSKIYINENGKTLTYVDGRTKKLSIIKNPTVAKILKINQQQKFFIYLPVPVALAKAVRRECEKNQNIVFVNNPIKADVSFYCSYYKKLEKNYAENYKLTKNTISKLIPNALPSGLVIVGSSEILGDKRYKAGHNFILEEPYFVADNNFPNKLPFCASALNKWFNYMASKRAWLNFDVKR